MLERMRRREDTPLLLVGFQICRDKAAGLGLTCTVQVECALSEDGLYLPVRTEVAGPQTAEFSSKASRSKAVSSSRSGAFGLSRPPEGSSKSTTPAAITSSTYEYFPSARSQQPDENHHRTGVCRIYCGQGGRTRMDLHRPGDRAQQRHGDYRQQPAPHRPHHGATAPTADTRLTSSSRAPAPAFSSLPCCWPLWATSPPAGPLRAAWMPPP